MKRVTMNLTETDFQNAETIERQLDTRSKAQAVSASLSLVAELLQLLKDGKLLIEKHDGQVQQLVIPGLRRDRAEA